VKVLWVLAGPNGAGKTTFYEQFLAKYAVPFVNADQIALEWKGATECRPATKRRRSPLLTGRDA
jgi:predicted ABC-type ATPase